MENRIDRDSRSSEGYMGFSASFLNYVNEALLAFYTEP